MPTRTRPATGGTLELLAAVRAHPAAEGRSMGHDSGRVQLRVDDVVVLLDLLEVGVVAEASCLEEVAGVAPQRRHLGQLVAVALEVAVVDRVEAGKGREK